MNETEYKIDIIYDNNTHKPIKIKFFKSKFKSIDCHIVNIPPLLLKIYCHPYNTELYEYVIKFIIDNEIGIYDNTETTHHKYITIIYFNIIDKELLLKFL